MSAEYASSKELTALFDLLVERDRVTMAEIAKHLGVRYRRAEVAVHDLRLVFGEDDTINIVCQRRGPGLSPVYFLTGQVEQARPWLIERIRAIGTQLITAGAMLSSLTHGTDGRTLDGRYVRYMGRAIERVREDLELLTED